MNSPAPPAETFVTTGVRLPVDVLGILRVAAVHRAERDQTRVSVSGVLSDLVLANRDLLVQKP